MFDNATKDDLSDVFNKLEKKINDSNKKIINEINKKTIDINFNVLFAGIITPILYKLLN